MDHVQSKAIGWKAHDSVGCREVGGSEGRDVPLGDQGWQVGCEGGGRRDDSVPG
jgi:hypothetical protein